MRAGRSFIVKKLQAIDTVLRIRGVSVLDTEPKFCLRGRLNCVLSCLGIWVDTQLFGHRFALSSDMKFRLVLLFSILLFVFSAFAREPAIFIVDTTATDMYGGSSVYYLDEYYAIQAWKKVAPQMKIVVIRADSNQSLTQQLENWMRAEPGRYEIQALQIMSHGARRTLANEKRTFVMRLPEGFETLFAPIKGHFAKGARVILDGCLVFANMDDAKRIEVMTKSLQNLGITDGEIFGYKSDVWTLDGYFRNDPLNKDIPWEKRRNYMIGNLFPYISWTTTYLLKVFNNKGVALTLSPQHASALRDTSYGDFFDRAF